MNSSLLSITFDDSLLVRPCAIQLIFVSFINNTRIFNKLKYDFLCVNLLPPYVFVLVYVCARLDDYLVLF